MDQPELSLGPMMSNFSDYDANIRRKRKHTWEEMMRSGTQTSVDLQLDDPLPVDWEQCLDLQSGKMYYMNRKTMKKSWARPKEQKLNLELNISTLPSRDEEASNYYNYNNNYYYDTNSHEMIYPKTYTNSSGSMVAVACLNCHLLVMLSKSSPACPNCKFVHSLQPRKVEQQVKSLETLSLLH